MEQSLQIILVVAPLAAGAVSIFLAFQLMKRFRQGYVTSYFYYLVFLYIFGVYSLIGSGVLEHLMIRMEASEKILRSARFFTILLGIPLLILAQYMLIRCVSEMISDRLGNGFTLGYFLVSLAGFLLYAVIAIRYDKMDGVTADLFARMQRLSFAGVLTAVHSLLFLYIAFRTRALPGHEKSFRLQFGAWYLLYMFLVVPLLVLSPLHPLLPLLFILFFLSWHLLPILFLSIYLGRYQGKVSGRDMDLDTLMARFSERFEISRREQEVISLICKGMSNQEIASSLYISLQTVKDHVHRIFVKTGVKNRVQLTNLIRSEASEET